MAANAWLVYDIFWEQLGNELHIMGSDTLKMALHLSGYTPNQSTDATQSSLGNEHANANGYTTGGVTCGSVTWAATAGSLQFDLADGVWNASGGSIVCRWAVLYNSSSGGTNNLIAYSLLDNAPADVTCTTGNTLTVGINASGVFTVA